MSLLHIVIFVKIKQLLSFLLFSLNLIYSFCNNLFIKVENNVFVANFVQEKYGKWRRSRVYDLKDLALATRILFHSAENYERQTSVAISWRHRALGARFKRTRESLRSLHRLHFYSDALLGVDDTCRREFKGRYTGPGYNGAISRSRLVYSNEFCSGIQAQPLKKCRHGEGRISKKSALSR